MEHAGIVPSPPDPPSAATAPHRPASTHRRCEHSSATVTGILIYHYVPCMNAIVCPIFRIFSSPVPPPATRRSCHLLWPCLPPPPHVAPFGPPCRLRLPPGYRAVHPARPQAPPRRCAAACRCCSASRTVPGAHRRKKTATVALFCFFKT